MPTLFISGHRDITDAEFAKHYLEPIAKACASGWGFVVGEAAGADRMAIELLRSLSVRSTIPVVRVFHMFTEPRFNAGFPAVGGFKSDVERDAAMTAASDKDLAWVRPGREKSGTAQNVERRNKKDGKVSMTFIHWPDIESFHNVRKSAEKYPQILGGREVVEYRGKVKLHGTNAAVQVTAEGVVAQSRTQLIAPGKTDNAGFAAWVETVKESFLAAKTANVGGDVIIYGEWCGPGIMKGTAINKVEKKVFAVFAAMALPMTEESELIVDPERLAPMVEGVPDVHVLPWYGMVRTIPVLGSPEVVEPILAAINADVLSIEACDPWVKETFGQEGVGEGIVYYPIGANRKEYSDLCFKAKGEKHKVVAKTAPAQIDPTVAASIDEYVEMVLPEARLMQGARSLDPDGNPVFDKKVMGAFIGWICKDVEKETGAELEAAKLTWKQVQKAVGDSARRWYLGKVEAL